MNHNFPENSMTKHGPLPHEGGKSSVQNIAHKAEIVDWSALYPGTVLLHGSRRLKAVALTFDDGPDDVFTPAILDVLEHYKVPATFMCVGQRVNQYSEVLEQIAEDGHVIGNHSLTHPDLSTANEAQLSTQISSTNKLIYTHTELCPALFRPPYGALSETEIRFLTKKGFKVILWDVDSLDWSGISTEQVKTNILTHTHHGSIILCHSAGGTGENLTNTVQALPYVIEQLREHGYKFVTVPKLLGIPAYFKSGSH